MTLRGQISAAFEAGARVSSSVAARAELDKLEPLVRLFALGRFKRLLERAQRSTTRNDPAHVLRLAAIMACKGEADADFDDEAAVAEELASLGPRSLVEQRPWWTLAFALALVLLVAGGFVLRRALAPFDPGSTPAGRALRDGLTTFVVALADGTVAGHDGELAREAATSPPARRAFGDEGMGRLERLLKSAERVSNASDDQAAVDAFVRGVQDFDDFLQRKNLPFFVDAAVVGRTHPVLMSSYVEREVELDGGGHHVRALHVWRLDTLRVKMPALGYTRPRTPAALVLLDQIETDLVRWVLPALPAGQAMEVVDEETEFKGEPWVRDVEAGAASILRRHYGVLDPKMARVGELLARRRALVRKWRGSLSGQGLSLVIPDRLVPEQDYAKDLEIRITRENLREWDALHDDLLSGELLAAFARFRDAYTLTIERHEVQHRLDYTQGFSPLPEVLARLLNVDNRVDLPEGSTAANARAELSSYLAQLADGGAPLLDLVLMSRLALNRLSLASPHSYAAVGALLSVGREFGIDPEAYLARGIRRRDVAELMTRIGARSARELSQAAAKAYVQCFGEPLLKVTRLGVREREHWRH